MSNQNPENIVVVETHKVFGEISESCADSLSVEEPLEIRIDFVLDGNRVNRTVAVTMRTPGNDVELACGFLFSEGVISSPEQIDGVARQKCGVVNVSIKGGVPIELESLDRHSFINSSCGVCGKKSIADVLKRCKHKSSDQTERNRSSEQHGQDRTAGSVCIPASTVNSLSRSLRLMQSDFDTTGGIHASALFTEDGRLVELREDVGRHNALDKLIGSLLLRDQLPLNNSVLFLSGRASFELIQKAAGAGIPIVASVGAPSSLAVQLATELDMTLIGFVRDNRFNIYCGRQRVICSAANEAAELSA